MSSHYKDFEPSGRYHFNKRVSAKKKRARNYKWCEDITDHLDFFYPDTFRKEAFEKMDLNFRLLNGTGRKEDYVDPNILTMLEDEDVDLAYENIRHHDIISTIAQAMIGEQRKRPFRAMARDTSSFSLSDRRHKKVQLYQQYIEERIMAPIREEAEMSWMQENGVEDPLSLSPEEQQEAQHQIEERVQAMAPPDIEKYMRKDYKTPHDKQAQKILDFLSEELDIKYITDEGFKNLIAVAMDIFYVGIENDKPVLEIVNPYGFRMSASAETMFVNKAEWATYERYITLADLYTKHGADMTPSEFKKLDNLIFAGGDLARRDQIETHLLDSQLVAEIKTDPDKYVGENGINIRTREGQERQKELFASLDRRVVSTHVVRQLHATWVSARKIKHITRVNELTDELETFFVDEHYEFQNSVDKEERVCFAPEVWETTKLGVANPVYIKKRRLPFQYKSLRNPFEVDLPYVGIVYGSNQGNSTPVSPIDRGKNWQYMFNWHIAKLEEKEATDIGKVALLAYNHIPKAFSFQKWMMMIRYGKTALIDTSLEGVNPADMQALKSLDLSNSQDIQHKMQMLEFIKNQAAYAMCYNPSRLGQISPYTAVSNNQQNIVQSSNQTEDLYASHNKVVEKVLLALLRAAKIAFRNNPELASYVMDDMGIASLKIDQELLEVFEPAVFVRNASEDLESLQQIKAIAGNLVTAGIITFPELIKLFFANNGSQVLELAEEAQMRADEMQQRAQEGEREILERQHELEKEFKEFEASLERMRDAQNNIAKENMAYLDSIKFARQMDINQNNINDTIEREEMKLKNQEKENEKDRLLKEKELKSKERMKKEELKVKEKEIKAKITANNKKQKP